MVPEGLWTSLHTTLLTAPADWDVLKVCGWGSTRKRDAYDSNWLLESEPFFEGNQFFYAGSCGYIVSGASARRLVRHLLRQKIKDMDAAIISQIHKDFTLRTYAMTKYLIQLGAHHERTTIQHWGNTGYPYRYPGPALVPPPTVIPPPSDWHQHHLTGTTITVGNTNTVCSDISLRSATLDQCKAYGESHGIFRMDCEPSNGQTVPAWCNHKPLGCWQMQVVGDGSGGQRMEVVYNGWSDDHRALTVAPICTDY